MSLKDKWLAFEDSPAGIRFIWVLILVPLGAWYGYAAFLLLRRAAWWLMSEWLAWLAAALFYPSALG